MTETVEHAVKSPLRHTRASNYAAFESTFQYLQPVRITINKRYQMGTVQANSYQPLPTGSCGIFIGTCIFYRLGHTTQSCQTLGREICLGSRCFVPTNLTNNP